MKDPAGSNWIKCQRHVFQTIQV